jgi:asparagine synthase (glutamine-hydrolysing)
MCGITGFWDKNLSLHDREKIILSMTDRIAHRGPDGFGYFHGENGVSLGHRRLSVLDLSSYGAQPMKSIDENYVITYNGEIYNFLTLKNDLINCGISFSSNSDTEVILKGYIYYGVNIIKMLSGMFSFVIYDKINNLIIAARDRIGIKPFYYYYDRSKFIFSSEIKSILQYPNFIVKPNYESIRDYFVLSYLVDNNTWYDSIYKLEQGHYLELNLISGQLKNTNYWSPTVNIDYNSNYEAAKDELKDLILSSINDHQQSDVEVGSHLSGGVDSSTIVSVISKKSRIHTFSSSFSGLGEIYDESKEIDLILNRFKTNHHQISANANEIIDDLADMTYILDEPDAGPATLPMFYVNKLINQTKVKVVNGGQGVDELFGGYPPSFYFAGKNNFDMLRKFQKVPLKEAFYTPVYLAKYYSKVLKNNKSTINYDLWINDKSKDSIYKYTSVEKNLQHDIFGFEKNLLMSLKYYLPALLHQEDRMSMRWSIESRVPFLDNRIVDFALRTPSYFKVKNGLSKYIFRDAVKGIVPIEILNNRTKRGYPTPVKIWFRNEMFEYISQFFSKNDLFIHDLFKQGTVKNIILDHRSGKSDNSATIWKLLNIELWFIENFGLKK